MKTRTVTLSLTKKVTQISNHQLLEEKVRFTNESETSIGIDASNEERRHEGALDTRPSLVGAESSEESEASSPGVTEDGLQRPGRV